jgi:chorismate lyase/3-hydroxybenzoate synthase
MQQTLARTGLCYVDAPDIDTVLEDSTESLLGCLGFGTPRPQRATADLPFAWVDMPVIGAQSVFEVWHGTGPVRRSRRGRLQLAADQQVLFGCVEIDADTRSDYDALIYREYCEIFDSLDELGYPNLIRAWHYLPDIHLDERKLERYKRFSLGRHEAFVAKGRDISRDAPAASAVGKLPGNTVICFLAANRPGTAIENPRQVSAYSYPAQYGPRGPTFSRALFTSWGKVAQLYISGTASIFGHASLHQGDPAAQAEETILNLQSVMQEARDHGLIDVGIDTDTQIKVYLRRPEIRSVLEVPLRRAFGTKTRTVWLQADICRSELLLEIEVVCSKRPRD